MRWVARDSVGHLGQAGGTCPSAAAVPGGNASLCHQCLWHLVPGTGNAANELTAARALLRGCWPAQWGPSPLLSLPGDPKKGLGLCQQQLLRIPFHLRFQTGDVCISILHPPVDDPQSGELPSERWNPTQNVR